MVGGLVLAFPEKAERDPGDLRFQQAVEPAQILPLP
jgi:hypothetical protein